MNEQRPSYTAHRERLRAIDRAIARYQVLVELASAVGSRQGRRSDRGWFVSMLTLEAGTLMAVLAGKRARDWNEVVRSLEKRVLQLQMSRILLQQEARRSESQ